MSYRRVTGGPSPKTRPHEESPIKPSRLHLRRFLMSLMNFMSECTQVHSLQLPTIGARRPFRTRCHPERSEGPLGNAKEGSRAALGMTGCGEHHRATLGASLPIP